MQVHIAHVPAKELNQIEHSYHPEISTTHVAVKLEKAVTLPWTLFLPGI